MENDIATPAEKKFSRFKFRENWPLWSGGVAFAFAIFCLLYNQIVPQYPTYYRIPVIYALLVLSSATLIFIPIILVIALVLIGIGFRHWAPFLVALLAHLSACYFCLVTAFTGTGVTHQQSLTFRSHVYYLGKVWDNSDWDSPETSFIVYDCDSIGFLCMPVYLSGSYYSGYDHYIDDIVENTALIADATNNKVYLRVGNDVLYVKDVEPDQPPAPVQLPALALLNLQNADQVTELLTLIRGSVSQLVWSPDGNTLAVGGKFSYLAQSDEPGVWLYDLDKLQAAPRLLKINYQGHPGLSAESVAFSPDGHLLAAGGYDYTVRLWNVDTGEQIGVLPGHGDTVDVVAFSPNGKTLASGSWYHEVWLWDVESLSNKAILQNENHFAGLYSAAFSPDGTLLASAGGELNVWDLASGEIQTTIPLPGEYPVVYSVTFSPDGKRLAYGGSRSILRLWDVEKNADVVSFELPGDAFYSIWSVAFSPDGSLLAAGDSRGLVRIWDAETGKQLTELAGHINQVKSVAFSPDGKLLASASADGTIRLWGVPEA
jgi:Tol biopolymer transport system component